MEETNEKKQERAVLVGLNADCFTAAQTATEETLDELEALLETAGGFCTGKVLQNRHTPDSHSFIGEGKAQEVRMLVEFTQSTMVVFDNESAALIFFRAALTACFTVASCTFITSYNPIIADKLHIFCQTLLRRKKNKPTSIDLICLIIL